MKILRLFIVTIAVLTGLFFATIWLLSSATPAGGAMRCYLMENFYDLSFDPPPDYALKVPATGETEPVLDRCDAADDPAIWVNSTKPSQSLILGTNKQRSLNVYDLTGKIRSRRKLRAPNNVDIRDRIAFAGTSGVLVGVSTKDNSQVRLFWLDPEEAVLHDLEGGIIRVDAEDETYGFCFYHNTEDGAIYAITTDKSGLIQQWAVNGDRLDGVTIDKKRELRVDTQPEGCVADDHNGYLYVGEEDKGIWRFEANPSKGDARTLIAQTGIGEIENAYLSADVEGLAIYAPETDDPDSGYLIASSQGNHTYVLFDRKPPHRWLGTFQVTFDGALVGDTDGLAVTSQAIGDNYPAGLLVVQDGLYKKPGRDERNQNFKLVSWEAIMTEMKQTEQTDPVD